MKGKILFYEEGEGKIIGEDGVRYSFVEKDFKSSGGIHVNMNVDFEIVNTNAKEIFLLDYQVSNNASISNDNLGCLLGGVCFLIPLVGLILYLTEKDKTPNKAKMAGKIALIRAILGILFYVMRALN